MIENDEAMVGILDAILDPESSGAIVSAVVREARTQGDSRRFQVKSVTVTLTGVAIKLGSQFGPLSVARMREARVLFGAVAADAYLRATTREGSKL